MVPMSISRRRFMKAVGTGGVLIAGGLVWRATDQGVFSPGTGIAYVPWTNWRGDDVHPTWNLVRAAILAANAHNAQPWIFHVTDRSLSLFADQARNLGSMDPLRREMYISLGCAVENLCLAAPANGFEANVQLMPRVQDPSHAAEIDLSGIKSQHSALYEAIPLRHTDRSAYSRERPIEPDVLGALSALQSSPDTKVTWFSSPELRARVGKQTVDATQAIMDDTQMSLSSARWFRSSWAEVQEHRDGITMDAQGMNWMMTLLAKMAPALTERQADGYWLQSVRDTQTVSAAAYGVISISNFPDRSQLIEAGRLWQRLHLAAITMGLAMQPLNQIVERTDREAEENLTPSFGDGLQALVGSGPWRGVFIFRTGYPLEEALPSPRRSLDQVLA